ncbi:MAG: arginine--tRNA ligase, partial [bacterium]
MEIKDKIQNLIKEVLKNLGINAENIILEHPEDFKNGDFSTNVAMVYAKELKKNPKELAVAIAEELNKNLPKEISKIEVAGAGFINLYLSREFFTGSVKGILKQKENFGKNDLLAGKKIMVEYTQPNPFKPFHIGHLMSNAIGESISRIVEFSGAKTVRANYQGDVGPHVAKAIYGLMNLGMPDKTLSIGEQAQYIGNCYVKGNEIYESNENAK